MERKGVEKEVINQEEEAEEEGQVGRKRRGSRTTQKEGK